MLLQVNAQWILKNFSSQKEAIIDDMNRDHQGYTACTTVFPGLKVTDIMDLVRKHGYGVVALTPLKGLTRAQGQALMERIREKIDAKRTADQVSHSCNHL